MKHIQTFESYTNENAVFGNRIEPEILSITELKKKNRKELEDIMKTVNTYLEHVYDRYDKAKGQEKKDLNYSAADVVQYSDNLKVVLNSK